MNNPRTPIKIWSITIALAVIAAAFLPSIVPAAPLLQVPVVVNFNPGDSMKALCNGGIWQPVLLDGDTIDGFCKSVAVPTGSLTPVVNTPTELPSETSAVSTPTDTLTPSLTNTPVSTGTPLPSTPTQTPSGITWAFCANENSICTFTGTMTVRYGSGTSWFYRVATNSIACNNATFGDPLFGAFKSCYYSPNGSTPTPQAVTQTPSNTPNSPTSQPPSPTAGGSSNIQPFTNAPLCPTHPAGWHGLWDSARGCHYDHEHGDNPSAPAVVAVFGNIASLWQGQSGSLSYPWKSSEMEEPVGFKYYVNMNPTPACETEGYPSNQSHCVKRFVILFHQADTNAHDLKRFHSYYMAAEIMNKQTGQTGLVYTGGIADFGCIHYGYKREHLLVPDDPKNPDGTDACGTTQGLDPDPYRTLTREDNFRNGHSLRRIWTSHPRYGFNQRGFFFYDVHDPWSWVSKANPSVDNFIGKDFNNSMRHVFHVFFHIPGSLDGNNDGLADFNGFTDVKGNIVQGCTAASVGCVPFKVVHAPTGSARWSRDQSAGLTVGDPPHENDIYFDANGNYVPIQYGPAPNEPFKPYPGVFHSGWIKHQH